MWMDEVHLQQLQFIFSLSTDCGIHETCSTHERRCLRLGTYLGHCLHRRTRKMLTVLVLVTIVLSVFWYWRKNYSFWRDQNVPQLPTWPIFGSYVPGKKPLQVIEQELYKTYGRLYGRYDGSLEVLSVAEPHLLKHILIKDFHLFPNRRDVRFNDDVFDNTLFALEGENWKRVRSIVTPNLTTAKLKRMLPLMNDCCDILLENIVSITKEKNEVNLQRLFSTFTIDVIGRCAFGISIGSLGSAGDPFVEKAERLLHCKLGFRTILTMLCPSVMKHLRISLLNPETTSFYRNVILDVMEERKKNKKVREDFLQLLLDVQNDIQDQNNNNVPTMLGEKHPKSDIFTVADESAHEAPSPIDSKNHTAKGLSLDELVAQCVTFFMAGYDATTTLLTNAVYHLTTNQKYQKEVLKEMKEAMEKQGGVVNYEMLSELKYLDAVLNECLRLCPSMVRNERRVENDCTLPETNIRLKKGMIISIPVYAMHRDPDWYPEPDLFMPDRFMGMDSSRPSLVHIPFGAGPRVCVGFRFVMMQVKLCLTRLLLRFHAMPATTTPEHLAITEVRNVLKINDVDILLRERTQ